MIRCSPRLIVAGGFLALISMQAGAAACANGVYNAGCVNRNGAVAVQKSDPPVNKPKTYAHLPSKVSCCRAGGVWLNGAVPARPPN